jgi:hypothetical protein
MNSTAPASTTSRISTDHGTWPSTGTSSPPRPNIRNDGDRAPRGAPPVQRNTAPSSTSSMPSVTMNDCTISFVVSSPFTRPTSAPNPNSSRITHPVLASSPLISLAAITTSAVTSAPTDRSNPPDTITRYCPMARITSGAARLSNAR